jgi:hypothetical protein
MKKNKLIFIISVFAVIFTSCEKDKDDATTREMLVGKSWKKTKIEIEVLGFTIDLINEFGDLFDECYLDNLLILNEDNTFQETEGATKCSDLSPQIIYEGTWSLSADEKTITLDYGGDVSIIYAIKSISKSTLVVTTNEDLFEQDAGETSITFTGV